MENGLLKKIRHINYLVSELDALYHQASLKIGMADSEMRVLYTVHEDGGGCLLSEIYKRSGISRQTVNSAVRKLEADGIIRLERHMGKARKVLFTQKGERYAADTVARLCEAEMRAFGSWTEEEIDAHVRLTEKYAECFRQQIQAL